jgi:hypothetical protein
MGTRINLAVKNVLSEALSREMHVPRNRCLANILPLLFIAIPAFKRPSVVDSVMLENLFS